MKSIGALGEGFDLVIDAFQFSAGDGMPGVGQIPETCVRSVVAIFIN